MVSLPKVWVRPAEGRECWLPQREGKLQLDGLTVAFDGHWRLQESLGNVIVTHLGDVDAAQSSIADQAELHALHLVAEAKRLEGEAKVALEEAKRLRGVADKAEETARDKVAKDMAAASVRKAAAEKEAAKQEKERVDGNKAQVAAALKGEGPPKAPKAKPAGKPKK